ncbi:nectin-4-like [Scleropages formosus]|uniref:nectin-4-like n=1 Tax=Scleropages formosus TaxID=113540 RepID=UPI0010FA684E|nr:nectin-4-like [Scleropages formosus]
MCNRFLCVLRTAGPSHFSVGCHIMIAGCPYPGALVLHLNRSLVALLCLLWCTASLAVRVITSGNLTVVAGAPATLRCELDGEGNISQVEWTRCEGYKILVFHITSGSVVSDDYKGRISEMTVHGFKLMTSSNDTGTYCCTLATFPYGNLKGQVHLQIGTPQAHASSVPMVTAFVVGGVIGGLLLLIAIVAVVLRQRRRSSIRNPVHVVVHPAGFPHKHQSFLQRTSSNPAPKAQPTQATQTSKDEDQGQEDRADYFNILSE